MTTQQQDIRGFFDHLRITNAIRSDWTTNHYICPARVCVVDAMKNGECLRNACPILWE